MVKDRDGPAVFVPGTCIGRYRIDSELGRGGTSVVYLATDLHLGKQWAVKVILQEGSGVRKGNSVPEAAGSMSALLEEAELMKRLDHPALPRIIDILEQDGMLILVMDYVKGDNLASLLARAGPFGESIVREWMYQLAAVLEYLHGQDPPVIYRDMKPANVIRKPDGSLILLDLGIAREYKQDREQDTTTLGTRGYAPPEQYGGAQTDIRSDIYSLGMTAAELLTGCPPDQDPYLYQTHPFRKLRPEISKEFDSILNRCLAFSPQDRYDSCRELMQDLRRKTVRREKRMHKRKRPESRKKIRHPGAGKKGKWSVGKEKRRVYTEGRKQTGIEKREMPESVRKKVRAAVLAGLVILGSAAAFYFRETSKPDVRAESVQTESAAEPDKLQEIRDFLEVSDSEGILSEESGSVLQQKLAEAQTDAQRNTEEWAEVCFAAGRAYLYTYTGNQGSFRGRVLRAQPLFAEALEYMETQGTSSEEEMAGKEALSEEKVQEYVRLCDFFAFYVYDREGIAEPGPGECESVLEGITLCLDEMKGTAGQETGESAWPQLTLLQSMEAMLGEYRQNFADAGIPQESVLRILQQVEEKTASLPVKREKLTKLRDEILQECGERREQITRTYASIEKWKEAENVYAYAEDEEEEIWKR